MRLYKKDKEILYNESLTERKDHLEGIIFDEGLDSDREDLQDILNELKMIYKVMKQIETDLNYENLYRCEYKYENNV